MDAITLLKNDHKTVEKLFTQFEKAGDTAYRTKRAIVDRIIEELSVHAVIEEQLFYPVTRATVPETEDIALESLEEHHIVKWVLNELDSMSPEDERFDAKVTVLMENVRHHVEEEEGEYFPKVRAELGRHALNELGDALMAAKKRAPTHPHPAAPDVPPGNIVAGLASGFADRVSDTVSGVAQGSVSAASDVIALALGRKKSAARPTGTTTARAATGKVRGGVDDLATAVIEKTQEAKRKGEATVKSTSYRTTGAASAAKSGVKSTARTASRGAVTTAKAAKSGAKGTMTSARRGEGDTKSTAKRALTTTGRTAAAAATSTKTRAKRTATTTGRAATRSAPGPKTQAKRTAKVASATRGTNRRTTAGRSSRRAA
jgi:hemerythrin superfamily protein